MLFSQERVLLGTEEGLFCVDLDNDEICKVGYNKKIEQLEYLPEEQLILCISGKQRNLRLIPVAALDLKHSVDWIKVGDTSLWNLFLSLRHLVHSLARVSMTACLRSPTICLMFVEVLVLLNAS